MSLYKTIREQLGLSQYDLAVLLDTQRSQLSYAELGTRFIGAESTFLLADLTKHWQAAIAVPITLPLPTDDGLKAAKRRATNSKIKLHTCKKEAAQMLLKYEQAIIRQRSLTPMLETETLTPKQKNWYILMIDTAESMIRKNNPNQQWLLQLEIQALE